MDVERKPTVKEQSALYKYYENCFPYSLMYNWIGHGSDEYFSKREWSFTTNEIYTRYRSWNRLDDFRNEILSRCPDKIDIGAVFSTPPASRGKYENFGPKEKEMVFDIDATDYADVFVATEATDFITSLTWPLMSVAIRVLDDILRADFGFQHLMFVFSGRRGIHCWVCDKRAREMSDNERSAVADYIQVITMNDASGKKVKLKYNLHPTLKRVYKTILKPEFERYFIEEQQLLNDEKHIAAVLALIPDSYEIQKSPIRQNARDQWRLNPGSSSQERWESLKKTIKQYHKTSPKFGAKKFPEANPIYDIVFTYTYPRLDINVSRQLNHLLKSPFVIHPGSQRVCVPINTSHPDTIRDFRPEDVPKINELVAELEGADGDWRNTAIAPYIEQFESFVFALEPEHDQSGPKTETMDVEDPK